MRRQLEAVEAAEGEVRRLLDELPEAVLLIDTDHVVHSTNAAALGLFDLARRELVESNLLEHADGDEQVQLGAAIQRAFEGDEVEPIQIEVPLKGALSAENIRVNVPSVFTVAVGSDPAPAP